MPSQRVNVVASSSKRRSKKTPPSGCGDGGGDGGGDDEDEDEDDDDSDDSSDAADHRGTSSRRRRSRGSSRRSSEGVRRKKESEECKFQALPRNAAEWQAWHDHSSDTVTSCSASPDRAFKLMAKVEHPDTRFEDLARVPKYWEGMNAKIRSGMSKLLIGSTADKTLELVSLITKKRDVLKRAATPIQITGLQMLFLVKHFYQINEKDHVVFELSALIKFAYQGDAKIPWWKEGPLG